MYTYKSSLTMNYEQFAKAQPDNKLTQEQIDGLKNEITNDLKQNPEECIKFFGVLADVGVQELIVMGQYDVWSEITKNVEESYSLVILLKLFVFNEENNVNVEVDENGEMIGATDDDGNKIEVEEIEGTSTEFEAYGGEPEESE